jgi:hypothetical protein
MSSQTSNLLVLQKFMKTFLERNPNLVDNSISEESGEIFDELFIQILTKMFLSYQKEKNIEFSIKQLEDLRKIFNFKYHTFYYFTVDLLKTMSFLESDNEELKVNKEVFEKLYQITYVYINGLYYLIQDKSNINDNNLINETDLLFLSKEFSLDDITALYQGYNYLSNICYTALSHLIETVEHYGVKTTKDTIQESRNLFINILKFNKIKISQSVKNNKHSIIDYFSKRQILYLNVYLTLEEEYKKHSKISLIVKDKIMNINKKTVSNNKNIIEYQCIELFDNINSLIKDAPKSFDYEKTGKEAGLEIIKQLNNDIFSEKFFIILDNYKKLFLVVSKLIEGLSYKSQK